MKIKFIAVGFLSLCAVLTITVASVVRFGPIDIVTVYIRSKSLQFMMSDDGQIDGRVYLQLFRLFVSSVFDIGTEENQTRVAQLCSDSKSDGNFNFAKGTSILFVRTHRCYNQQNDVWEILKEAEKTISDKEDTRKNVPNIVAVIFDGKFESTDLQKFRDLSTGLSNIPNTKLFFFHMVNAVYLNKPTRDYMVEVAKDGSVLFVNMMDMDSALFDFYEAMCKFTSFNATCEPINATVTEMPCRRRNVSATFPFAACNNVQCECPFPTTPWILPDDEDDEGNSIHSNVVIISISLFCLFLLFNK